LQPWKFSKLLNFDSDTLPIGIGSSEVQVPKTCVGTEIDPKQCISGSYNFCNRPTVGWTNHWKADVIPAFRFGNKGA
jgi:hypothetical protein